MPLFPFVWQYNNQPIEVLAADIAALSVNTGKFLPVSTGYSFIDSPLKTNAGVGSPVQLWGNFEGQDDAIFAQPSSGKYYFGAYEPASGLGNRSRIEVDDSSGTIDFKSSGPNLVRFGVDSTNQCLHANGVDAATAGVSANLYLTVRVNNIPYKIELLNN
jgi:hypothetical protein